MNEQVVYTPHAAEDFTADKLLPCPFCGNEAVLTFIGNDYAKKRKVEVKCKGCRVLRVHAGMRSGQKQLALWSIEDWNKRI